MGEKGVHGAPVWYGFLTKKLLPPPILGGLNKTFSRLLFVDQSNIKKITAKMQFCSHWLQCWIGTSIADRYLPSKRPRDGQNHGNIETRILRIRKILERNSLPKVSKTIVQIYISRIIPTNRVEGRITNTK